MSILSLPLAALRWRAPRHQRHTSTHADGRPLKITFGEMSAMGLRGVLVYCHCGHHVSLDADRWLSDLEPRSSIRRAAAVVRTRGQTSNAVTRDAQSWVTKGWIEP
ncbi:murein endopeptidase [Bradyrhizobium sp. USDA 4449]